MSRYYFIKTVAILIRTTDDGRCESWNRLEQKWLTEEFTHLDNLIRHGDAMVLEDPFDRGPELGEHPAKQKDVFKLAVELQNFKTAQEKRTAELEVIVKELNSYTFETRALALEGYADNVKKIARLVKRVLSLEEWRKASE